MDYTKQLRGAAKAMAALALVACSSGEGSERESGNLQVVVQPLELPGVAEACYQLTTAGADGSETWDVTACSGQYGDGAGSITYVGPCDATSNPNSVSLVLESLSSEDGTALNDFFNPCPADSPCVQQYDCRANEDVSVEFNLTVLRDARQGFFDIAVNFDDVFCSAKLDCAEADGSPIELLMDAEGQRQPTAVMAVACTAGAGEATHLYMSDVEVQCTDPSSLDIVIDPTQGPGNLFSPGNPALKGLLQAANYSGVSTVALGGELAQKTFSTTAIAPDFGNLRPGTNCRLRALATATEQPAAKGPNGFKITAGHPIISFDVPLVTTSANGEVGFGCTQHALHGSDGIVSAVTRAEPAVLRHEVVGVPAN